MKAVAEKDIEEFHLLLLYQSLVLGVKDCGPGLTTTPQTNLPKPDREQSEVTSVMLEVPARSLTDANRTEGGTG